MADNIKVEVEADKLEEFLNNIEEKMQKASTAIIEDLANLALDEIQKNYSKAEYGQAREHMDFLKNGTDKEKIVSMAGPQAWYSEFGTGTYGKMQPHPLKGRFALNPYNSGKTIRPASEKVSMLTGIPVGSLYWTYKADNGQVYYSQGIPAQKQVYNAGQTVQKKIPEISMKRMKEMFN